MYSASQQSGLPSAAASDAASTSAELRLLLQLMSADRPRISAQSRTIPCDPVEISEAGKSAQSWFSAPDVVLSTSNIRRSRSSRCGLMDDTTGSVTSMAAVAVPLGQRLQVAGQMSPTTSSSEPSDGACAMPSISRGRAVSQLMPASRTGAADSERQPSKRLNGKPRLSVCEVSSPSGTSMHGTLGGQNSRYE